MYLNCVINGPITTSVQRPHDRCVTSRMHDVTVSSDRLLALCDIKHFIIGSNSMSRMMLQSLDRSATTSDTSVTSPVGVTSLFDNGFRQCDVSNQVLMTSSGKSVTSHGRVGEAWAASADRNRYHSVSNAMALSLRWIMADFTPDLAECGAGISRV